MKCHPSIRNLQLLEDGKQVPLSVFFFFFKGTNLGVWGKGDESKMSWGIEEMYEIFKELVKHF